MLFDLSRPTSAVVATAAIAGIVISWALFIQWGLTNGLDPVSFWTEALVSDRAATGLTWDLIGSGVIVSALAWARRQELGTPRLAAVLASTWILGVCAGLAVLLLSRRSAARS